MEHEENVISDKEIDNEIQARKPFCNSQHQPFVFQNNNLQDGQAVVSQILRPGIFHQFNSEPQCEGPKLSEEGQIITDNHNLSFRSISFRNVANQFLRESNFLPVSMVVEEEQNIPNADVNGCVMVSTNTAIVIGVQNISGKSFSIIGGLIDIRNDYDREIPRPVATGNLKRSDYESNDVHCLDEVGSEIHRTVEEMDTKLFCQSAEVEIEPNVLSTESTEIASSLKKELELCGTQPMEISDGIKLKKQMLYEELLDTEANTVESTKNQGKLCETERILIDEIGSVFDSVNNTTEKIGENQLLLNLQNQKHEKCSEELANGKNTTKSNAVTINKSPASANVPAMEVKDKKSKQGVKISRVKLNEMKGKGTGNSGRVGSKETAKIPMGPMTTTLPKALQVKNVLKTVPSNSTILAKKSATNLVSPLAVKKVATLREKNAQEISRNERKSAQKNAPSTKSTPTDAMATKLSLLRTGSTQKKFPNMANLTKLQLVTNSKPDVKSKLTVSRSNFCIDSNENARRIMTDAEHAEKESAQKRERNATNNLIPLVWVETLVPAYEQIWINQEPENQFINKIDSEVEKIAEEELKIGELYGTAETYNCKSRVEMEEGVLHFAESAVSESMALPYQEVEEKDILDILNTQKVQEIRNAEVSVENRLVDDIRKHDFKVSECLPLASCSNIEIFIKIEPKFNSRINNADIKENDLVRNENVDLEDSQSTQMIIEEIPGLEPLKAKKVLEQESYHEYTDIKAKEAIGLESLGSMEKAQVLKSEIEEDTDKEPNEVIVDNDLDKTIEASKKKNEDSEAKPIDITEEKLAPATPPMTTFQALYAQQQAQNTIPSMSIVEQQLQSDPSLQANSGSKSENVCFSGTKNQRDGEFYGRQRQRRARRGGMYSDFSEKYGHTDDGNLSGLRSGQQSSKYHHNYQQKQQQAKCGGFSGNQQLDAARYQGYYYQQQQQHQFTGGYRNFSRHPQEQQQDGDGGGEQYVNYSGQQGGGYWKRNKKNRKSRKWQQQ